MIVASITTLVADFATSTLVYRKSSSYLFIASVCMSIMLGRARENRADANKQKNQSTTAVTSTSGSFSTPP